MLRNLLNQTATIWNPVPADEDDYGNAQTTFVSAGNFPCRVQPWKGVEFEFDRDTKHTLYRIMLSSDAVGIFSSNSQVTLGTNSQLGTILDSVYAGADAAAATVYHVYGDPQMFHKRSSISHIEATLRTIEG